MGAVAKPTDRLSAISLTGSNYGANIGKGYGGNAPHDTSVPLTKVPKHKYLGRSNHITYVVATGKIVTGANASVMDLTSTAWKQCNGDCLSAGLPASENACTACKPGEVRAIRYYLASEGGRKNYYEHHCTCLRQGTNDCYAGGSHDTDTWTSECPAPHRLSR